MTAKSKKHQKKGVDPEAAFLKEFRQVEKEINTALIDFRAITGSAKGILAACKVQACWSWLRAPNPLYTELETKLKNCEEAGTPFWNRLLLSNDLKAIRKSMDKKELKGAMEQAVRELADPMTKLSKHNQVLTNMHSALMSQ